MRITVLSRSDAVPSTARILREASSRGHSARVLNPVQLELVFDAQGQELFYERKRVQTPDVVVPRLAGSVAAYGLAVVDQFVMLGAVPMNDARAIARSRNPMRFLQVLAANGLAIPPTRMVHQATDLTRLSRSVGGFPLLVKILRGTEKHSTMVCESHKSLQAALEAVLGLGHQLVLQQYLKGGRDVRVMVLGGEALVGVEKKRLKKGKKAELVAVPLPRQVATVAERAARALSLEVCSVDVLDSGGESHVVEINATPALAELEKLTGLNLARKVVERAEALYEAKKPERPVAARNRPVRLRAVSDKE